MALICSKIHPKNIKLLCFSKQIYCNSSSFITVCNRWSSSETDHAKDVIRADPDDTQIHTGQKWNSDDYRMARFAFNPKQVNSSWAIDLIKQVAPKPTKDRIVWCNGGGGALGHPKVFINLDQPGDHTCGYCGLRFYKEDHH